MQPDKVGTQWQSYSSSTQLKHSATFALKLPPVAFNSVAAFNSNSQENTKQSMNLSDHQLFKSDFLQLEISKPVIPKSRLDPMAWG